jgi:hypothetical protein
MRAANFQARQFYAALGFAESGICRGYYAGIEDARCMVHDLRVTDAPRA